MEGTECAALVIAAGGSERWGGRPKALLDVAGQPAVRRVVEVCHRSRVSPILVVAGEAAEPIGRALEGTPAELVRHPGWALGRTGSIQAGLARLDHEVDVLLWPVDHPLVEDKTLRELERAARVDQMAAWFVPTYLGERGHPVRWRGAVTSMVRDLAVSAPLRSLLPRLGVQVLRVPVDDPGVVENLDTPLAYEQAIRRFVSAKERP